MRKLFIYSFFILLLIPLSFIYSASTSNSGFIPGQIWYSNSNLVVGETVNIYTAVWNGNNEAISAKVEFYDKNVVLGSRDITVNPNELKEVSVSWKITAGDHLISAKIISSTQTISGKKESITLSNSTTSSDKKFVSVNKNDNSDSNTNDDSSGGKLDDFFPEQADSFISDNLSGVEKFRIEMLNKTTALKNKTKNDIAIMESQVKTVAESLNEKKNLEDAVKQPIAHIKLILLSIIVFILATKVAFYGLLVIIIFYILRAIYRKIKNR